MRNGVKGVIALMMLMLFALSWSGCSKKSEQSDASKTQPLDFGNVAKVQAQYTSKEARNAKVQFSDEEILKAIDDSGIMKRSDGSLILVPPAKIVEKGKRNLSNGSWPVKVKFTVQVKMKDGKLSPPTETTSLFSVTEEKDGTGKPVLKVKLGS